MRILAIDTALDACSVALLDGDMVAAEDTQLMARGHAEALMPMLARLRDNAAFYFSVIDRIAVTVGPGSFTGLRVGISAARGIGLATGKPVVGITTLEALAAPLIAGDASSPVVSVIDARHNHVYLQAFGTDGDDLVSPRVTSIAEALELVAPLRPRLVGNAAAMLAAAWPSGTPTPAAVDQQPAPLIEWVGRLGQLAEVATAPPKPFYLKAPDALPPAPSLAAPIAQP
ncbi:MAG: tRNA (adenosine(37)-N6)-threonylcarbamoyltransferase complex dimerization subunit type 1 TsaB [Proteobacteria bacterium]|nr:tRNA (adenosine(37)-N6)-threonylcarbamoyltransferase complex dimerization subunit type 1 TsaB [Pseudomonadota bacterium]